MADAKRTDPYLFEPGFERVVIALLASNRAFYDCLGPYTEPDAFADPSAKELARLTKITAKTLGRGPGSRDVILQTFAEFARSGKATIDQKIAAAEYLLDLPKDFDAEPYIKEFGSVVRKRFFVKLTFAATQAVTQGKEIPERLAEQFARLPEIGRVEVFGSEGLDGDMSVPQKSTTGIGALDEHLEGGLVVNGLGVFCGGPKSGKSLSLSGVAAAKFHEGKFVAFLSTELPSEVQRARVSAAIADCRTADVQREQPEAMEKLRLIREECESRGAFYQIERMKIDAKKALSGWTADDVLFWLDRLTMQWKRHPDVLVIDYADHLCAKGVSDSYRTGFVVYSTLVNAAQERKMQIWTAAQGTRQKKESSPLGIYDFSDSMHKVRLVDLAVTISPGEKGFSILKIAADRYVGATGIELDPLPNAWDRGYLVHSKPARKENQEPDMFEGFDFGDGGDDVLH